MTDKPDVWAEYAKAAERWAEHAANVLRNRIGPDVERLLKHAREGQ